MAKNMYFGVDGTPRRIKNIYFGVDGAARKVKAAFIGIDGVARQFYSSGIPTSIHGFGSQTECYALYGGTKYYTNGNSFDVNPGGQIAFHIFGGVDSSYPAWVKINGATVLTAPQKQDKEYAWTVPNGTSAIIISLAVEGNSAGQITVTTT